ncbi:MAG: PDZ domain-containing protein, partial [Gemmatimonadota bacterium]|nr:PDZ domain-containing protein [Gemmatimonadota bacterium]
GGAPAYYVMYNGMSPRGTPSVLRLVGLMRGSEEYAFIISSPTSEFQNAKGFLQAMEMSFSYGRGGGRGNTDDPQFPQQPRQYPPQQPQQQPQFPQQPPPQYPQPPQQDPQQPRNQPQFPQQQPQFPQQQPQFPQQQPPMASSTGKASMGVALRNLDKDDQNQLGFKDTNGAIVAQVQSGSAAEQAGIIQGDVIVNADRQPINSAADLVKVISSHRMGDQMEITVVRQGRPQVLHVQFGGSGRRKPLIPT